jgi:hypothetical protein
MQKETGGYGIATMRFISTCISLCSFSVASVISVVQILRVCLSFADVFALRRNYSARPSAPLCGMVRREGSRRQISLSPAVSSG